MGSTSSTPRTISPPQTLPQHGPKEQPPQSQQPPRSAPEGLDDACGALHDAVTHKSMPFDRFKSIIDIWLPDFTTTAIPPTVSSMQKTTRTNPDSFLLLLLKNQSTPDYTKKVQLLTQRAPFLLTVRSHGTGPTDLISQAALARVPQDVLLLLLDQKEASVICYDGLLKTPLFQLLQMKNLDPKVIESALHRAQREIDEMHQMKRFGTWIKRNKAPNVSTLSQADVEPTSIDAFISSVDLHGNSPLTIAIQSQLSPSIIAELFNFIDAQTVEDIWEDRDKPARTKIKTTTYAINSLGLATSLSNNFATVRYLASRGLTRPRPLLNQFNPRYRFIISYFAQLHLPTNPQFESTLHALFCHYNPLIHTFFRLGALPRQLSTLDLHFYTTILNATHRLQKLLQLFQWIPDTSIQEALFVQIDASTRYMRHLPHSWNHVGLLRTNTQQLMESYLNFPTMPRSFFTSSHHVLQPAPHHILKAFQQFIDEDWFTNQIDANVAVQFHPDTIKSEPLLRTLQSTLLKYAEVQPVLDTESITTHKSYIAPVPGEIQTNSLNHAKYLKDESLMEQYFAQSVHYNTLDDDFNAQMNAEECWKCTYHFGPNRDGKAVASQESIENVFANAVRAKKKLRQPRLHQTLININDLSQPVALQYKADIHLSNPSLSFALALKTGVTDYQQSFESELDWACTQDEFAHIDDNYRKYSALLRVEDGFDLSDDDETYLVLNGLRQQSQPTHAALSRGDNVKQLCDDVSNEINEKGGDGCPHPGNMNDNVPFVDSAPVIPPHPAQHDNYVNDTGEIHPPTAQHFVYQQLVNSIMFQYFCIWRAYYYFQLVNNPASKVSSVELQQLRTTTMFHKICHSGLLIEDFYLDYFPQTYNLTVTSLKNVEHDDPENSVALGETALKEYSKLYSDYFYPFKPFVTSTVLPFNCANGAPIISLAFLDYVSIVTSGVVFSQPTELLQATTPNSYSQYVYQLYSARQQQYFQCFEQNPARPYITNKYTGLLNPFCLTPGEIPQPGATINFDLKSVPGLIWWVLYYTPSPNYDDIITLLSHCRTDILNHFGQSTLMVAIARGWTYHSLVTLARSMININLQDVFGRTALHYFALTGAFLNVPEFLDFLVHEMGAVVNIVDAFGHSPLTYAIYNHAPEEALIQLITYTLTRTAKQVEVYYSLYEPADSVLNPAYDERFLNPRPFVIQPRAKQIDLLTSSGFFHPHEGLPVTAANSNYVSDTIMYQHLPPYPHNRAGVKPRPMTVAEKISKIPQVFLAGLSPPTPHGQLKKGEVQDSHEHALQKLTMSAEDCTSKLIPYKSGTVVPDAMNPIIYSSEVTTARNTIFDCINGVAIQQHRDQMNAPHPDLLDPTPLHQMLHKGYLNYPYHLPYLLHTSYSNDFIQPFILASSARSDVGYPDPPTPVQHRQWTVDQLLPIFLQFRAAPPPNTSSRYPSAPRRITPPPLDDKFETSSLDEICNKLLLHSGLLLNIFEIMLRCRTPIRVISYLLQCITYAYLSLQHPEALFPTAIDPASASTTTSMSTSTDQLNSLIDCYLGQISPKSTTTWYSNRVCPMEDDELSKPASSTDHLFFNTRVHPKYSELPEWQRYVTSNSISEFIAQSVPALQPKLIADGRNIGLPIFLRRFKS